MARRSSRAALDVACTQLAHQRSTEIDGASMVEYVLSDDIGLEKLPRGGHKICRPTRRRRRTGTTTQRPDPRPLPGANIRDHCGAKTLDYAHYPIGPCQGPVTDQLATGRA